MAKQKTIIPREHLVEAFKNKPGCVVADISLERLALCDGNSLIAALPPRLTREIFDEVMPCKLDFSPEQRNLTKEQRIDRLKSLKKFMLPSDEHYQLISEIDSMMYCGYAERNLASPEHARMLQQLHQSGITKESLGFEETDFEKSLAIPHGELNSRFISLLMGMPGLGKSTVVEKYLERFPKAIYHPELHVYQIPALHVEMPSDGASIKAFCHEILEKMDALLPGANYRQIYSLEGRPSDVVLVGNVIRLLKKHYVGVLIADEVQNFLNAKIGGQKTMTHLVTMCNKSGVPILFIGTNKAAKIFKLDARLMRRLAETHFWDRLPETVPARKRNEWREAITALWKYQWVRKPVNLDERLLYTLYECSQGIMDYATKLFIAAQSAAIIDGSEEITPEQIVQIYNKRMKFSHELMRALRDNDLNAIAELEDVRPVGLDEFLNSMSRRLVASGSRAFSVKPGDPNFAPQLANALVGAGIGREEAHETAMAVERDGSVKNVMEGIEQGHDLLKPLKRSPKKSPKAKGAKTESEEDYSSRPGDYRQAILDAARTGVPIFTALATVRAALPTAELFEV